MPDTGRYDDKMPIERLRLDPRNPRLPRDPDDAQPTDDDLLAIFLKDYNLLELARSIAGKGFSPRQAEALLVVEEPVGSGDYVAVEGNRRLATLKLLTDSNARRKLHAQAEWNELADRAEAFDLVHVPVLIYETRADLDDYLGYRHITGPAQWRPENKARFIAKLLTGGDDVDGVWRRIGSNKRTVQRYAEAHAVFEQLLSIEGVDISAVERGFGVLYNALDWANVRTFLSLRPSRDFTQYEPSPVSDLEALRQVVGLLFGDESRSLLRVLKDSRDLRKLNAVLADPGATSALMRHRDLDRAWQAAGGGRDELLGVVADAYQQLIAVNGQAFAYKNDSEVVQQIENLLHLAIDMASRYGISLPKDESGS